MLKQRIITALVLGPLVIWSVLSFPHPAIAIEMAVILCIGAWEWARLSGITSQIGRVGFALFNGGVFAGIAVLMHYDQSFLIPALYLAGIFWLFALVMVIYFNRKKITPLNNTSSLIKIFTLIFGSGILAGSFLSIVALHRDASYGSIYILALLILIWAADSCAYFAGKAFGKHKLAVNVSPGKSWEGVIGGLAGTIIAAYLFSLYLDISATNILKFIFIALITIGFSIVGDLTESLFKRRAGIKDSSQILPGHGGIMDRIDSLVAAAPIFILGLIILGVK